MRKTVKRSDTELAPEKASWLDVSAIARVEVTSEDSQYPIESAFAEGDQRGWRAAERGKQTIRLFFDEPQRIRRIWLRFIELHGERTQQFTLQLVEGQDRRTSALASAAVEFQPQRLDEPDRRLPSRTQLETHYRFNPGYLGSDHCSPEPGAGRNARALCYRRTHAILLFITAAAGFALGVLSHIVAKHKGNPLRRFAREFS
jgi:hypothetical protein